MSTIVWALGLFCLCVGWGFLMNTAMNGASTLTQDAGTAIGLGSPVFGVTALGSGLVYFLTKSRTKALWGWFLLILVAFTILGIGAAQIARVSN